jgi:hypothetical protein
MPDYPPAVIAKAADAVERLLIADISYDMHIDSDEAIARAVLDAVAEDLERFFISRFFAEAGRAGGRATAASAADRRSITKAARAGRWQRYLDRVPAGVTDPDERARQATELRRADMTRISHMAADARRKRPAPEDGTREH